MLKLRSGSLKLCMLTLIIGSDIVALISETRAQDVTGDPVAGETVFVKCKACHSVDGTNQIGPFLNGVVGRPAGTVEGYKYSIALENSELVWTVSNLNLWLFDNLLLVPGNKEAVPSLKKDQQRADVISFLAGESVTIPFGDPSFDDQDGDGVLDSDDSCPLIANPTQTDTDGDGIGDACDPDDDNDGIADASDNCPLVVNVGQDDNEGDGAGDACDADDDNDGMPDVFETANGLDPFDPADALQDADGDGFTNLEEFKAKSDPLDPNSVPSPVKAMPWLLLLLDD